MVIRNTLAGEGLCGADGTARAVVKAREMITMVRMALIAVQTSICWVADFFAAAEVDSLRKLLRS
jgi:hypothetical protein